MLQTNKILTLVLLFPANSSRILLGMKKRGFGAGKWNGFGGKVLETETISQGAQRELMEEAGISCSDLSFCGLLSFEFEGNSEIYQVHVFKGSLFQGEVAESEEMRPAWFETAEIPYEKMWADDRVWMQKLLKDQLFQGKFVFLDENTIKSYDLQEVSREELLKIQRELINFALE